MHAPEARRRPGFVIAAAVVGVIVVLAVVVTISIHAKDDDAVAATAKSSRLATTTGSPDSAETPGNHRPRGRSDGGDDSICGLPDGKELTSKLQAPEAVWKYDGPTGYPTSPSYGPGRTADAGFRYCYQHSASGALFAAAGSIAFNNRSEAAARAWSRYSLADGPYRDQLLHSTYVPVDPSMRSKTIGYRLLSYDTDHAKIDLAVRVSSSEQTVLTSVLMDLVWQHGDWRFSTDTPESVQATRLVDLAGYTRWSDD